MKYFLYLMSDPDSLPSLLGPVLGGLCLVLDLGPGLGWRGGVGLTEGEGETWADSASYSGNVRPIQTLENTSLRVDSSSLESCPADSLLLLLML